VQDNHASRESVAVIFGKMLGHLYTVDNNASLSFLDKGSIASSSVPYVDLLSRLGILVGDTDNNFTPKAYINRAEMAVVASKTYDVLGGSGGSAVPPTTAVTQEMTGVVSSLEQYGDNKLMGVMTSTGQLQGFLINNTTYVLKGNTTEQLNIGYITQGTTVAVTYEGQQVKVIRIMSDIQSNIEVKGTVDEIANTKIYILNSDGKIESYYYATNCKFTLDGKTVTMKGAFDAFDENNLKVTLKLDGANYVQEANFTKDGDSAYTGILVSINDDEIAYKEKSGSTTKYYEWASDYTITLENSSTTISRVKSKNKEKTLYVKFFLNSKKQVKKLMVSEDKFTKTDDDEITGTVSTLSSDKVRIKRSDTKETETFNFYSTITYYLDGEETTYKKVNSAYEAAEDKGKNFYVKVELNSSDKVRKLYASTDKNNLDGKSYKKIIDGTLYSITSDSIRVKDGSSKKTYDEISDDVDYYLNGKSSSVKAIDRALQDAGVDELYVTLYLNSDGEVTKVEVSEDEDNSATSGKIKSMTKNTIKLSSGGERDLSKDVDIRLDDEDISVSKMVEAVDDDDRKFEAKLTTKGGEVTKIVAYTVSAEGDLVGIDRNDKEIKIKTGAGEKITYKLKSSNVDCTGDWSSTRELEIAYDDGEDIEVKLTLEDGKVVKIYADES
ncbi:MAG: S-layer homology domain-containing protein, partial [Epulopiscium sp.]|nr:S-layer homology domain-containing protein [Candidatus Epulonipiscium sp.]